MERQFASRMLVEQIEHRPALGENLRTICLVVSDQSQQLWLGHRAARMLRHDLNLLAGRDLLQFDKFAE